MADNKPIEIKIDNKEVLTRLQELASRGENLRPLMKNIAGIMATTSRDLRESWHRAAMAERATKRYSLYTDTSLVYRESVIK